MSFPLSMMMKNKNKWYIVDWWIEFKINFSQYGSFAYDVTTNTISSIHAWPFRIDICLNYSWLSNPIVNTINIYIYENNILIWNWSTSYSHTWTPPTKILILRINYGTNKITWTLNGSLFLNLSIDWSWKKVWTFWIDYLSWPEFGIWDRWHKIFNTEINIFDSENIITNIFSDELFTSTNWDLIRPEYITLLSPWVQLRSRNYWDSWSKSFLNSKNLYNFN